MRAKRALSPLAVPARSIAEPSQHAPAGAAALDSDDHFWLLHEPVCTLGRGCFGSVQLARIRATGSLVAVKVVDKTPAWHPELRAEAEPRLLAELRHPHIVRLIGVYASPLAMFVLMEPELGGDLLSRMAGLPRGVVGEREARRHAGSLLSAVEHMHSLGIVHRDIKPSNVLLSAEGEVRLADFGLAARLPPGGRLTTMCGTHDYLAPEMIRTGHGVADGYGAAVDLWGVGLLLFVILFGHNPFERGNEVETLQAVLAAAFSFPPSACVSAEARALIASLLVACPARRLTASQCLRHGWTTATGSAAEHMHSSEPAAWAAGGAPRAGRPVGRPASFIARGAPARLPRPAPSRAGPHSFHEASSRRSILAC